MNHASRKCKFRDNIRELDVIKDGTLPDGSTCVLLLPGSINSLEADQDLESAKYLEGGM